MNKMLYVIAFTLLLGGCSAPGELRQKGPTLELKSLRDAKHVAACIADKWMDVGGYIGMMIPVSMKIIDDGYSVDLTNNGSTALLVNVKDIPTRGSVTFYYEGMRSFAAASRREVVVNCQN